MHFININHWSVHQTQVSVLRYHRNESYKCLLQTCGYILRRRYKRRFATTIFSATQRCNIVATLFRIVTTLFQHCSNIATLCCAKNRRCESSRVTLPLNTALIYKKTSHADVVSSYRAGFLFILLLTPLQKSISLIFFPTISKVCSSPLQDQSKNQ